MPRVGKISRRAIPTKFEDLVALYPPRAIHDDVDYRNAQELLDTLTSLPKLSRGQSEYLDTLTILFEAYEDEHHAIELEGIKPSDVLKHLMDERGMNASDLGRLLGERSLGAKVLSGDRELSKTHIRNLARHFNVSADLFL
jgi:antitoxin component HigA of HigAB toxin-antitoxin module